MPPTFGISAVTKGKIDAAINVFNKAFWSPPEVYEQTLTGECAYFDYGRGDLIQFPMRINHHRDQDKGLTATRDFSDPGTVVVAEVGYNRVDLMGELLPLSKTSDPLQIFLNETPDAIAYAIRLPLRRVVKRMQQNGVCKFDDKTFFNTAHICDPTSKNQSDKFSNDVISPITEQGWANLNDQILQMKGGNGYFLNASPGRRIIWVPTDKMHVKFAKLFTPGAFYGKEVIPGASAASESITVTSTATIVTVPELLDSTLDSDADKRYYVWLTGSKMHRGMVVRIPLAPFSRRSSGGADDDTAMTNDAMRVAAHQEYGDGYGLPHKLIRAKDAAS